MIIQIAEDISDIGISINIFKSIMWFQVKEGSEFIQSCRVPMKKLEIVTSFKPRKFRDENVPFARLNDT